MSRSGYMEEGDLSPLEMGRWRGIVASATRGKRGQKLLHELAVAMDAMPVKRLIREELEAEGEFCALGCVGKVRGVDMSGLDPEDADQVGRAFDIAPALAQEIVFINDDWCDDCTEEQRWERVRKWVGEQIVKKEVSK